MAKKRKMEEGENKMQNKSNFAFILLAEDLISYFMTVHGYQWQPPYGIHRFRNEIKTLFCEKMGKISMHFSRIQDREFKLRKFEYFYPEYLHSTINFHKYLSSKAEEFLTRDLKFRILFFCSFMAQMSVHCYSHGHGELMHCVIHVMTRTFNQKWNGQTAEALEMINGEMKKFFDE